MRLATPSEGKTLARFTRFSILVPIVELCLIRLLALLGDLGAVLMRHPLRPELWHSLATGLIRHDAADPRHDRGRFP
jgi:hypothetical protein